MYKWIRNTHLLIGLFACLFLLMYGVSSVQMAHNKWFSNRANSRVQLQHDIAPHGCAEARGPESDFVVARGNSREGVDPLDVGRGGPHRAAIHIPGGDGGPGNCRAARVGDGAGHAGADFLAVG